MTRQVVGDPSGKTSTRASLSAAQTSANSAGYFGQLMRVLDPDRVEVRRNSEWLAAMTMTDVLREAKHVTVAQLLEREDFARRYRERQPISAVRGRVMTRAARDVAIAAQLLVEKQRTS